MEQRKNTATDLQDPAEGDQDAANENIESAEKKPAEPPAVEPPQNAPAHDDAILPADDPAADDAPEPAVHPEYYSKITISDGVRLDFHRATGSSVPPVAYRALRKQIEEVARVVRILFQDDQERLRKFIEQLHVTADSGLRGTNSSTEIGVENLEDVKNGIADEFPTVRGKIWWWNFALLGGVIAICALASIISLFSTGAWYPASSTSSIWPTLALAVFLVPLGVMVGLFVEFIFRVNDDIPYEQLRAINPGRWKPFQRAFNTALVAYIFAGILGADAVQVGVANILLNNFKEQPALLLVIGFVSGFAFPFVRDLVQQFRPAKREPAE